ncbi:MAG: PspC domain-containing protein [Microthrixaceae bacterium]
MESHDVSEPEPPGSDVPEPGPVPIDPTGADAADDGISSQALAWLKTLRRSSKDRILTGVAGGLAERIGVPSLIVRAAFVLAALAGFGIPVYLIAWVLIPSDRGQRLTDGGGIRDLVALGIVVVAGLMLTGQVAGFSTSDLIWRSLPWALMLAGAALVLRRREPAAGRGNQGSGGPPPFRGGDAAGYAASAGGTGSGTTGSAVGPTAGSTAPWQAASAQASAVPPVPPAPMPRPVRTPRFPVVGLLTWCLVLVVCGAMGALALAGLFELGPGTVGAVALCVFGAGLVFSAFRGKARGLILPALALAVVFAGLGAVDVKVDNLDGGFNLAVADAAELPGELRTSLSDSSLDLRELTLNSDRFLRIDQTAGSLTVLLPEQVNTKLDVQIGVGTGSFSRPSRENAVSYDQELARIWFETGVPKAGDPVEASLYSGDLDDGFGPFENLWGPSNHFSSGVNTHHVRTIEQGGEHTLELEIHMGAGSVRLIDPHWSKEPMRELKAPSQLCTVGGGERGVVKACGDVPESKRVALCINDSLLLVDCREDRPATADYPRIPACTGFFGDELDCAELGIDPVGAQLVSPTPSSDDGSDGSDGPHGSEGLDGPIATPAPSSTIRLPDPPATTPITGD